jgi:undecaprenyl-diphosphatase
MKRARMLTGCAAFGACVFASAPGRADPGGAPQTPPTTPTVVTPPAGTPRLILASAPPLEPGQHFTIDPVADGVLIAGGGGFSALLSLVLGTGEIKATLPGSISNLLPIDRGAVTQTIDTSAGTISDALLWTSIGFAVLDPILSGIRDGGDAFLVDAVMYGESIAITEMLTDITKIAVRRPRPIDYVNCSTQVAGCTDNTDLQLSFFSGHAATVASIGATATYLAFQRDPKKPRPWITLGLATAMTALVSYERVRSGEHFPTDVIAGSLAGAAVGVLVPHLHRHTQEAPPVYVGVAPQPGGGSLTLGGRF